MRENQRTSFPFEEEEDEDSNFKQYEEDVNNLIQDDSQSDGKGVADAIFDEKIDPETLD